MTIKQIKNKGETSYDLKYDILFFKIKDRDYSHSIEIENIIVDIDNENLVIGLRIMEASEFFKVPKEYLSKIPKWQFTAVLENNRIQISIELEVKIRNKTYVKNPIIIESLKEKLPDSEIVCSVG